MTTTEYRVTLTLDGIHPDDGDQVGNLLDRLIREGPYGPVISGDRHASQADVTVALDAADAAAAVYAATRIVDRAAAAWPTAIVRIEAAPAD